jgi:two-component system, LytTR family, sensor histidine kinase AlgZ
MPESIQNFPHSKPSDFTSLLIICAISFCLWMVISVLYMLAVFLDQKESVLTQSKILILWLINCALALMIWRKPEQMLKPSFMLLSLVLMIIVGLPLLTANKVIIILWFADKSPTLFLSELKKSSIFVLWVDLFLISLSYFLQTSFAIWQRTVTKELELIAMQNESIKLRLQLLQGQFKPHFLFNSLNSISALVRGADRQLARAAVKQLHALLRYVLESSKHDWLSVADELQFIRDYLNMQLLRFGDRMQIEFQIEDRDWHALPCPPLLFQPLVENAIYHGVENHHEQCCIYLKLTLIENKTSFRIRNVVFPHATVRGGHGLGISSTRERLQILYQHQANLLTTQRTGEFIAEIRIPQVRGVRIFNDVENNEPKY